MRGYSKITPQFWIGNTGKKIKDAGVETQLLALYLMTSPHASMIGIYYIPIAFIAHEIGISTEATAKALQNLSVVGFCTYDESMEYVWIYEMANYQIGCQLKQNDNRVKGINDIYKNLPNVQFLKKFHEKYKKTFWLEERENIGESSKPLLSQEQEYEQEQEQKKISMSGRSQYSFKTQAIEVLQFLNEKIGRAYRPVDANLKLIIARLKSGATVMDCRQVIAKKTREWKGDSKMSEYLRPATLFNATKFEQYMGELVLPQDISSHAN